ncbi:sodium-dependent glucose transporter 1A-like [Oppia nitens]|uniref:sodium-dependent glucose transporter 1A-like n=1 Tax=Oppia nitens TaxID=1686743 RepID=UPI0023D995F0|nr:sodium-dependent glucose transporter 1A-like [Oppia nitens]
MDTIINDIIEVDNNTVDSYESRRRRRPSIRIDRKNNWHLYVYTIAMFFNHLAYGIIGGLIGPTLVDFKYILNTTMEMISISLIMNNIGYLSGALFGLLYKYVNRQLVIVITMTSMATSIALMPHSSSIAMLFFYQYLNGLGAGVWDAANNVWLIEMWPQNSSPVLQFSQFFYGLGSVFGPILVRPYLTGETQSHNSTQSGVSLTADITNDVTTTPAPVDRKTLLSTPFLISGILQGFIPVVLLFMFFIKQYKNPEERLKRKNSSESLLSNEGIDDQTVYSEQEDESLEMLYTSRTRTFLVILFSLLIAIYSSIEIAHFSYSSTYYQFIPLHVSAKTTAEILSVMSTSYTVGRCISAFVAIKVGPQVMIVYHLIIVIIGMAILYYGSHLLSLIWFGNVVLGFGFSAMYSAIIALTAMHCKMTDTVSTLMVFTNGVVSALTPYILGPIIETNPFSFILLELIYLIISILLFLMITIITRKPVNRSTSLSTFIVDT